MLQKYINIITKCDVLNIISTTKDANDWNAEMRKTHQLCSKKLNNSPAMLKKLKNSPAGLKKCSKLTSFALSSLLASSSVRQGCTTLANASTIYNKRNLIEKYWPYTDQDFLHKHELYEMMEKAGCKNITVRRLWSSFFFSMIGYCKKSW